VINLAIVDDHAILREGLISFFSGERGIKVSFDASNGLECLERLPSKPETNLIITDIDMPVLDGIQLAKIVTEKYSHIKLIALSMHHSESVVKKFIQAGGVAFILKSDSGIKLADVIRIVHASGRHLDEWVKEEYFNNKEPLTAKFNKKHDLHSLSANERKFLEMLPTDLSYAEIAFVLHVSPRTVENYRNSLFQKLEVNSRTALVITAIKRKLIKLID